MYFAAKYVSLKDMEPDKKVAAIRENNILKFLRHKNITRYIDTFIEDDTLIIVMELCECGPLDFHIKYQRFYKAQFTENDILSIIA